MKDSLLERTFKYASLSMPLIIGVSIVLLVVMGKQMLEVALVMWGIAVGLAVGVNIGWYQRIIMEKKRKMLLKEKGESPK